MRRRDATIPLFDRKPVNPFAPIGISAAVARSFGQGWPQAGARALPLTEASTVACSGPVGGGARVRSLIITAIVLAMTSGSIGVVSAAPVKTQSAPVVATNPVNPYAGYIAEASRRFGIPESWIRAVMRVESRGQVKAVSLKGAIGLMQIMPDTWAGLQLRYRLGRDPRDPRDNILAGPSLLTRDARSLRRGGLSRGLQRRPRPLCGVCCGRPPATRGNARLCRSSCAIDWRRSGQPRCRDRSRCHRMVTCATLRCGCRQHLIRTLAAIRRSIARKSGCRSLRAGTAT